MRIASVGLRLGDRHLVDAVDLLEADVDPLLARRRQVLADVVGADRQLAVAAVAEHRQLHPPRPAVVEERLDRGAHGAAGEEDVVDEDDGALGEVEVDVGGVDDRLRGGRLGADVVAVEGDVEVADRQLGPGQLAEEDVQAAGEHGAAGVDADDREPLGIRVLLGDLVGDPPQRSPQIVVLQHDLLTHFFASFLASRDRVKGRPQCSSGAADAGRPSPRMREARRGPTRPAVSRAPFGIELGLTSLGEGDLDEVEVSGGDRSARRPPGPPRAPCRRGSGRRCGRGRAASRGPRRRRRRPGRRSSGRFRRRAAASSSAKLASWISSSASAAAATVAGLGAVSPVSDDRAAGAARRPSPARARPGPSAPSTSSPRCSAAKAGPSGTPGGLGRGAGSKRPGPLGLDQRVAVGAGAAVRGLEGLDLVAVVRDRVARLQLDQVEREAEPADQRREAPGTARAARAARRSSAAPRGRSGRRSSAVPAGRGCGRRGSGSGRSRRPGPAPASAASAAASLRRSRTAAAPPHARPARSRSSAAPRAPSRRCREKSPPDPSAASLRDVTGLACAESSARSSAG